MNEHRVVEERTSAPESSGTWALSLIGGAFLVLVLIVVLKFTFQWLGATAKPPKAPPPVTLTAVTTDTFVDTIEAIGTAHANESVTLTAKVTETVRAISFEDGQHVEKGALVAELLNTEQSADLAEARAAALEASQQFDRISNLVKKGNASQAQLDSQRAARDAAAARVDALEARLDDRLIRAPFAGVLGLRSVSPGELVAPGDPIVTLDDISIIKVDFSVPESFLAALKPGLTIRAKSAAYPDRVFEGKVAMVDTRVDPVSRAVLVRAIVENGDGALRPGMLMSVDLVNNERRSLVVPEIALVPVQSRQYVYVVKDGVAHRVPIEIGTRRIGDVEVTGGLNEGDLVITEGTNRAADNKPVKVVEDPLPGKAGGDSDSKAAPKDGAQGAAAP